MLQIFLVMAGGALGSVSRYGASLLAVRIWGTAFPWGTLFVNLVGCFLIGFAYAMAEREIMLDHHGRLFFITGFLGGLTTFSSYGLESVNAFGSGSLHIAFLNIAANNVLGLLLVFTGIFVAKFLTR